MICTLGGQQIVSTDLYIPWCGMWTAIITTSSDQLLTGQQSLVIGSRTMLGTIVDPLSGVYNYVGSYRVVGGYGGWGKAVLTKPYHNDLGVKLADVVRDLAAACGERATCTRTDRLPVDYLRSNQRASLSLIGLIGVDWHVADDGSTVCDPRVTSEIKAENRLLNYDPIRARTSLYVEDLASLDVGMILRTTTAPQVIRSLEIRTNAGEVHINAEGKAL